ncbi:hypothetical protein JXL19_08740 [bacterium]|nr:hypothetical protein [bacterium]
MKRTILVLSILVIALCLSFSGSEAYYGGYYGSSYYGGLYGSSYYGGLYGSSYYGGLYGGYGGLLGGYGGLLGGYGGLLGGYGGLYGGLYGGSYGGYGYSPFSYSNLYYPVSTAGGLTYQVPFLQIAPLLGVAGLYNQLFPNLFNPTIGTTLTTSTLPATPVI